MKLTNVCTNCQTVEDNGTITIFSYGTPVLRITQNMFTPKLSSFTRLWDGYSVTTMRHINKALGTVCPAKLNKSMWDAMPVWEV